jgi:methionyl-tRNA formyltransferase
MEMRLVMMGNGPFAAPTFRALYRTRHTVAALVTRPPRPLGQRYKAAESPLPPIAAEHGTPTIAPEDVNAAEAGALLAAYEADLFIVCDFGQILSSATLALARLGGVNLHASLLPKYRGAAPINWAIYHGERDTGVTVIHMTPRLDAGPCIGQLQTPIGPEETVAELETRLAGLGAPLVCTAIDQLEAGTATAIVQDNAQATKARRLRKEDGEIDWSRTAQQIHDQVRALSAWPRSSTTLQRSEGEPLRVIVERTRVVGERLAAGQHTPAPGEIVAVDAEQVVVATGGGMLAMCEMQPAGKRRMPAGEFARGYRVKPGDRFVREPGS